MTQEEMDRLVPQKLEELTAVMTQLPEEAARDWALLDRFFLDEIHR